MKSIRRHGPRRRSEGAAFTVVEVVIALILAAMAIGAVVGAMAMGRRTATMAKRQLAALHEARATLEDLGRLDFHHAQLQPGRYSIPGGYYEVTLADSPTNQTKNIVVGIRWIGTTGATNWVTLTTSMSAALHP